MNGVHLEQLMKYHQSTSYSELSMKIEEKLSHICGSSKASELMLILNTVK